VLTGPHKTWARETANKFRNFFRETEVEILPFTAEAAEHYAQLRGSQRVDPADAIHLACAAQAGMDLFLTNDHRLRGLVVPGIHFIAGMDVELL
jgi:predicted nucleic acid-binding protein